MPSYKLVTGHESGIKILTTVKNVFEIKNNRNKNQGSYK